MNDLTSKTVEYQRWTAPAATPHEGGGFIALGDYLKLARRLEEAQQKILAQQVRMMFFSQHLSMSAAWADNQPKDDLSALTAHDAEVAAKALEEAVDKCRRMVFRDRPVTRKDCEEMFEAEATEYRAKAKGEK